METTCRAAGNRPLRGRVPFHFALQNKEKPFASQHKQSSLLVPSLTAFGLLGIEPSLHPPEGCVRPVYYSPKKNTVGMERFELSWDCSQ